MIYENSSKSRVKGSHCQIVATWQQIIEFAEYHVAVIDLLLMFRFLAVQRGGSITFTKNLQRDAFSDPSRLDFYNLDFNF